MLGNGDCTVIKTPQNKIIVIDTGEQENVIAKYLLDKKIKKVDYLIISHFDSDHCKSAIEIIEKLKVKQIVIGKQAKLSKEFENLIDMAKENKINIQIVKAGDTLKLDKYTSFKILWPDRNLLQDNPLNNNSIVAKLEYKSFSMLFTGDIEALAEKQIVSKYKKDELQANILKVAHHGSKTSSINEFVEKVRPQISVIGVGENNKFGHPNLQTLETLKSYGSKVYRTDLGGEITIRVNKKGKMKIKTHV